MSPTAPFLAIADAQVYLPYARPRGRSGRIAVAAFDEDIVSMGAVAAAAVLDRNTHTPTAVLLATTSAPLAEGGAVQEIAEIIGVSGPGVHVAEHGGTTAAGLGILVHAAGLVGTGSGPVLVIAADDRRDHRGRPLGAGAVVLLVSDHGDVATIRWSQSRTQLLRDHWRRAGQPELRNGDRSLAGTQHLWHHPPWGTQQIHETVVSTPLGPVLDGAGALGCAGAPVAALLAMATADPDAVIVAATSAGGVGHAVELTVGPQGAEAGRRVEDVLSGGAEQSPTALTDPDGFAPFTSGPRAWRERGQDLRLEGQRDLTTGEVLFPPVPLAAAEGLETVQLARHGTVLTMTRDHVFPYGGPIQMVVVELQGGGRFFGQAVPEAPDLAIGDPVGLVPRRLYDAELPQYYWKVVPESGETVASAVGTHAKDVTHVGERK